MPSVKRNPAASSASSPGVRIVIDIARCPPPGNPSRISSGSSTARTSGDSSVSAPATTRRTVTGKKAFATEDIEKDEAGLAMLAIAHFTSVCAVAKFLFRRNDAPAAFAEPDPSKAFAFAEAFHDYLVTVFEKTSLFSIRQIERFGAAPSQFEQASAFVFFFPAHRPGRHQIARLQVAAVRSVMREHLADRPVEVFRIRTRKQVRFDIGVPHLFGLDINLEIDVEAAKLIVLIVAEIIERPWIAGFPFESIG